MPGTDRTHDIDHTHHTHRTHRADRIAVPDITRLGPIVDASACNSIGANIEGPALIRVPDWVTDPLGGYYLYFADHKGTHIRLAHADRVERPWTVHRPGSLTLADSGFPIKPPPFNDQDLDRVHARLKVTYRGDYSRAEALEDATLHVACPNLGRVAGPGYLGTNFGEWSMSLPTG